MRLRPCEMARDPMAISGTCSRAGQEQAGCGLERNNQQVSAVEWQARKAVVTTYSSRVRDVEHRHDCSQHLVPGRPWASVGTPSSQMRTIVHMAEVCL
jgi:hypothetical protein|eukprot:SAG25_NODE_392_length_8604_cov_13.605879_11_plen_98_part_00